MTLARLAQTYRNLSLTGKLFVPIFGLLMGSLGLLSFGTYFYLRQQLNKNFEQNLLEVASVLEDSLKHERELLLFKTRALAERPEVARGVINRDTLGLQKTLLPLLTVFELDLLQVVTSDGTNLLNLQPPNLNFPVSNHPIYRFAASGQEITGVIRSTEGTALLASTVAIKDREKRFGGLVAGFTIDEVYLNKQRVSSGTELMLVKRGQVVVSTATASDLSVNVPTNPAASQRITLAKQEYLYRTIPISSLSDLPAYLVVLKTTDSFKASQQQLLLSVVILAGTGGLLSLAISIWMASSLSYRLRRLTQATQSLATGNFTQNLPIDSKDEIGILAAGFNDMVSQLNQRDRLLLQQQEALEQTVETRTTELRIAKDQAEEGNRVKSEFLAVMSHELRTPLNAVMGFTELLRYTELTPEQEDYVISANDGGKDLLALINDILDFTRIESGGVELNEHSFALHALVQEVVDSYSDAAKEKSLNLSCHIAASVPDDAIADAMRLDQILSNLVGNAIKFTETGSVIVQVEATPLLARQGNGKYEVAFIVQDTGIGITTENYDQLFQPFSQVDSSNSRRFGGTGLGLSISKRLCEKMGGTITVKSQLGQGSTFTVVIPLRGTVPNAMPVPAIAWSSDFAQQHPLRVLVAEDNPFNQKMILKMLGRLGYAASLAENGQQVLEQLQEQPYDLIFMDVQMPVMDGLEATKRIRNQYPRQPKIVGLSAHAMETARLAGLEAGMNDYLTKPVEIASLAAVLEMAYTASELQ
ncbi:hypothetical protein TUMEXPCC7403_16730 [Tumidithrix helvetica PCC 7403]|uniref:ATP-binding protein n=1 Tax=Tumidithrix helvetica TaxID=3457545 RepID=UPI003CA1BE98